MEEFDYVVKHRAGNRHGNADALSRRPDPSEPYQPGADDDKPGMERPVGVSRVGASEVKPSSDTDIGKQQALDGDLKEIHNFKNTLPNPPSPEEIIAMSATTKAYVQQWDQLRLENGILYRLLEDTERETTTKQLVVPTERRKEILEAVHAGFGGGHFGIRKTMARLQRKFYWAGWTRDVREFCRRCERCATYYRGPIPKQGYLSEFRVGEPMERWGIDITGPHPPSSSGHRYILTAIDYFTRWVEAFPMRNQEAETVARILIEQVFSRYGLPMQLISDQGPNFESTLFREMCRLLKVDKVRTTPYKARTNGLIERWHKVLNTMLAKVVADNHRDWNVHLPYVCAAYRATEHNVTGYTPNFLFLGREAIMPIDLTMEVVELSPTDPETFVERQKELIRKAHELVRDLTKRYVTIQKRRYDLRVRPKEFSSGDWVYYLYPRKRIGRSPKWTRMYTGPYLVVGVLNSLLYRIQRSARSKPILVHVDKLKKVER